MRFWLFFVLFCSGLWAEPVQTPQEEYGFKSDYVRAWTGHKGHAPLITDITFRSIADHVIDQIAVFFDPEGVEPGDIIYVNARYLAWFEEEVHPRILHPYILLTCDVGGSFPDPLITYKLLFDPKLAAWFCKNIVFSYHPKLFQLPMGHHILYWSNVDLSLIWRVAGQTPFFKERILYMNHLPREDGNRNKIVALFEHAPYCFSRNHSDAPYVPIARDQYYADLASSHFVISPPGLEADCVRNWEAFLFDCIPIVEHSFFDALFDGLPVAFVHNWEEINLDFLREQYKKLHGRSVEKAYFDYWRNLIEAKKNEIRRGDLFFPSLEATKWSETEVAALSSILTGHSTLVYRSLLTPMHAIQLACHMPSLLRIYLYDPWLSAQKFLSLADFLREAREDFLSVQGKFAILQGNTWTSHERSPIFLDLTYYCSSLLHGDPWHLHYLKPLRHKLLEELDAVYQTTCVGVLIAGNRAANDYVREVLHRFAKKHRLAIETKGDFWFFTKPFEILQMNEKGELETFLTPVSDNREMIIP